MGTVTASVTASPGTSRASRAVFLIVEDDEPVAHAIAQLLRPLGEVVVAHSRADALAALASGRRWTGLIIDWHLPDGSGLDVLGACRQRDDHVPALMITGDTSIPKIANEAYALHAWTIFKPFANASVTGFASEAIGGRASRVADTAEVVHDWQERYGFTSAETFIFRGTLHGKSREDLARKLGIGLDCIKKHVHNLLQKTRDTSLDAAVIRAQREIINGAVESSPQGE